MWPVSLCYEACDLISKYNILYKVTQIFRLLVILIIEIFKSTSRQLAENYGFGTLPKDLDTLIA